jgi:hypothetical protein
MVPEDYETIISVYRPQSSSASRFTAGAFGFLTLTDAPFAVAG